MTSSDKETEFLDKLSNYDFIRVCTVDLNGIHLSKVVPKRHAKKVAHNQVDMFCGLIAFGFRNEPVKLRELEEARYGNGIVTVIPETLRPLPWASCEGLQICEILCETHMPDGSPIEAHPRRVLRRQLDILERTHKCKMYAAFEPEYRAFHNYLKDECLKYKPLNSSSDMYRTLSLLKFENFFAQADKQLNEAGILIDDYSMENGIAQLESPLTPCFGVQAADMAFSFRQAIKEIALNHGFFISHMTTPIKDVSSSGIHFNHSLWDAESGRNLMYDANKEDKLSEFMLHWIGGVMAHLPALTVLCNPTVNCYRRLKKALAPTVANWDIDQRFSCLRIKNRGEKGTYAELRLPSSASCSYLVMAATIAAGIDGLTRKLQPPLKGDREHVDALPDSLQAALDIFEKDTVLCESLGEQFCRWFVTMKRETDLKLLPNVDLTDSSRQSLQRECDRYFEFL